MNYLISSCDCCLISDQVVNLMKGAKYKISNGGVNYSVVFPKYNSVPFVFALDDECEQVLKVKSGCDNYYFLFPTANNCASSISFSFKNKNLNICVGSKLIIFLNDVLICEEIVNKLNYSHHEIQKDICLIFFEGDRNFVVVIKDEKLEFASYYDECNISEVEKYFMCRCYDSLNHGKVCHIKDGEVLKYLVYLDDNELNLKSEFLHLTFIDCVKAGNFKYANLLLGEDLKMTDDKNIKEFFPEFDFYFPIDERKLILINKNTLAGIYDFDIKDNKIVNISC